MRCHFGTCFFLLLLGAIATIQLAAQGKNALPQGHVEVAVTYNAARTFAGDSFWLQGGSSQIEGRFYGGLGVVDPMEALRSE